MRVISGKAKGMKLTGPPAKTGFLRPTSDRSREALFSILGDLVHNAAILDLFAGTGALGLEALSRGAASVHFVDNNTSSLAILEKNIRSFFLCLGNDEIMPKVFIHKSDLRKDLNHFSHKLQSHRFNIIFLDPPYDQGLARDTLVHLDRSTLLEEDCLIIVEERAKTDMPEELVVLTLHDQRQYGDTGFWLYSPKPK